jgi:hypothetical protein
MTAALAAFSLQDEIERYGAYAGIAAVFGLGILSLLYFAQAREVKRLREWAGRAPERAAELEARVTADAQRRVAPAPQPTPRPTAPATPAAQQGGAPPTPGIAAPATAAAAAAGASGAPATTVAKPGTTAPQNGTGSGAAVPAPGTEAKDDEGKEGETGENGAAKEGEGKNGEAKSGEAKEAEAEKPDEAAAATATGESKPFGPQPKPAEPEAKPPVPAATAAAGAAAAGAAAAAAPGAAAGPAGAASPGAAATTPAPTQRPAPLRAPTPSASLPPRTPAGARPRTGADDGRSPGRIAAIVGAVVGVLAVLGVAGILIFGGGDDNPAPKPNTVAQPAADSTTAANGAATPSQAPAKLNRKAVPLAVLNGTTVTGLARGAADKLTAKGYNEPNVVTNDTTNQARPTTQIFYEAKARAAALDVAKVLGVATSQVKPMDANARALADRAEVAVFVGADKAQ